MDFSKFSKERKRIEAITKEEMEKKFSFSFLNELQFSSPRILRWVNSKCEKRLRSENYRAQNSWMHSLYLDDFKKKHLPKLFIKHVNQLVGYGLFAADDLAELSLIGEYTGIVRRRRRWSDRQNAYIFGYVVGPHDTPYVIDAKEKGNLTRFINHSETPNCISRWMIVDGVCHVIFFTNKLIKAGEQLTYNYGPHFWKNRMYPLEL
ncbi:MAG: SET domain-containing protein-lysine N-methyltransferase [Candidatus Algichlamydia australiensis]|nr:SET domain-containing protein-lysine N-methyltransferase [Chlamydiales bacterium]